MATKEQLIEANKKAVKSPLIGKHGKWKKTIEKEERRKLFEQIVSQDFPKLVLGARPEYLLDQFLGKAPDILQADIKTERIGEDITALAEIAAKLLKQKKL